MTLLEKLESGMRDKRAELINQPLARVWGELAKVASDLMQDEINDAFASGRASAMGK